MRDAARGFSETGAAFLAQAIAFNALFAAIPLTLVTVTILAFVYGTDSGLAHAHQAIYTYAPAFNELLGANLETVVRYRGFTGIIALIGLLWSGKNVFQALTYALDRSAGVTKGRHIVLDVAIAVVLVPFVGIVLVVVTALPVVITLIVQFAGLESLRWAPQIASYATSLAFVFAVFALLYAYLPNRRAPWSAVIPGALVAAVGYSAAQIAFAVYTTYAAFAFRIYGALSALFVLLLWLDVIGIVFLFGAHITAAVERESRRKALSLAS